MADRPRVMFTVAVFDLARHERPDQQLQHAAGVVAQGISDARAAGGAVTDGDILGPQHEAHGRWHFMPAGNETEEVV